MSVCPSVRPSESIFNSFIRRLRWKVFHADKKNSEDPTDRKQEMKGQFRSKRNPPFNPDLEQFERDLIAIIRNIKYRRREHCANAYLAELDGKINSEPPFIIKYVSVRQRLQFPPPPL